MCMPAGDARPGSRCGSVHNVIIWLLHVGYSIVVSCALGLGAAGLALPRRRTRRATRAAVPRGHRLTTNVNGKRKAVGIPNNYKVYPVHFFLYYKDSTAIPVRFYGFSLDAFLHGCVSVAGGGPPFTRQRTAQRGGAWYVVTCGWYGSVYFRTTARRPRPDG